MTANKTTKPLFDLPHADDLTEEALSYHYPVTNDVVIENYKNYISKRPNDYAKGRWIYHNQMNSGSSSQRKLLILRK